MKEIEDWSKYIKCDIKHDASREYDLNTFITEFKEHKQCKSEKEIQNELMKKIQDAEIVFYLKKTKIYNHSLHKIFKIFT